MSDKGTIIVAGGAGYIGAHACLALAEQGYTPVCFDSFATGWREAVQFGPLAEGDLLDPASIRAALQTHRPKAVMHFAARSLVGESQTDPELYYRNNVVGTLNLLAEMRDAQIEAFVFSSTAAVYGEPDGVTLEEDAPTRPINAYGRTKLAVELLLKDFGHAHNIRSVVFRYFNVAGADPMARVGERHAPETHLIPIVLDAASGRRDQLTIFGDDYPTPDGTCIRDYIHVSDLVAAHILGLEHLLRGGASDLFNLGTGTGFSVRDVVANAERATGLTVPHVIGARRSGDPASLVAGGRRAEEVLGWNRERSVLETMIADAWRWHQKLPGL